MIAAGATSIKAVALKFVRDFPSEVEKIAAAFEPGHLDGAELVFAATDSAAVNDAVAAEAHRRGIWLNRADGEEDDPGDFTVPAVLRCGPITVAVSASGSPALAAGLRDSLAGSVTDDWVKLAEALKQLRPRIKASGLSIARRREILRTAATTEAAAALSEGGAAGLIAWLRQRFKDLPELNDGVPA